MWPTVSPLLVTLVLCMEFALLTNGSFVSDNILGRYSQWDCLTDVECTANGTSCISGYCECAPGYFFNSDMTECIRRATAYGDACSEKQQCSGYLLEGGTCENSVCVCADGYHYIHGRCYPSSGLGDSCEADVNCYVNADTEALSCVNGTCVCSEGFYQREYRTCRRIGYAVGDECAIDLDCKFANSYCTRRFVCADSADSNGEMTLEENHPIEDDRSAERIVRVLVGAACDSDANCTDLGNSKCGPDGTCICNRGYYASADLSSCLAAIGEECGGNDTVIIRNSLCRNGTWSCGYSTVASLNQQICRKSTKSYNFSCTFDEQCYIFGPDASCQKKRCLCNSRSHWLEDQLFCWTNKGIGESCVRNEDCYVEGLSSELSCNDSVCTCPPGTTASSDKTSCQNVDATLNESCEFDANCTIANSACIDGVCGCAEYYYPVDEACLPGLNATCSTDDDCTVPSSVCSRAEVCECGGNTVAAGTNLCKPVADYGEECEYDIQCSSVVENAYCSKLSDSNQTTACACRSDYHYRNGGCNFKSRLGSHCSSIVDCYLESGQEYAVCLNGRCACDWESTATSPTSCETYRGDATTFFFSTSLGLVLLAVKILVV